MLYIVLGAKRVFILIFTGLSQSATSKWLWEGNSIKSMKYVDK